jgi:hypothetical protein
MKKRRTVFLEYRGTPTFPRYVIIESSGKVWTGKRWGTRPQRPLLFADADEAAKVAQILFQHEYRDATCVERFVVPIYIEVRSQSGIDPDDLKRWLRKALTVQIAYGTFSNGPTDDSLVLVNVDWSGFVRSEEGNGT